MLQQGELDEHSLKPKRDHDEHKKLLVFYFLKTMSNFQDIIEKLQKIRKIRKIFFTKFLYLQLGSMLIFYLLDEPKRAI